MLLRLQGRRRKGYGRGGHGVVGPVMLAEPEHVEADLIGQHDLLDEVGQALGGADAPTRRRAHADIAEGVEPDFHASVSCPRGLASGRYGQIQRAQLCREGQVRAQWHDAVRVQRLDGVIAGLDVVDARPLRRRPAGRASRSRWADEVRVVGDAPTIGLEHAVVGRVETGPASRRGGCRLGEAIAEQRKLRPANRSSSWSSMLEDVRAPPRHRLPG